MHFVFSRSELNPRSPDEMFEDQARALESAGHSVSVVDVERLRSAPARIMPPLPPSVRTVYRGWMLAPDAYANLVDSVEREGASLLTSLTNLAPEPLP